MNVAVIPARYASTRFPGKPLAAETGKLLIQHVYERVTRAASIDRVLVATDDRRIAEAVQSFGGQAIMTRADHASGTDRVAEVADGLECHVVVNVQGDEPEIEPEAIDTLVTALCESGCSVATLACGFDDLRVQGVDADPADPNRVKVVTACDGRALYFTRSPVPYARSGSGAASPLLHLGIYAYRRDFLLRLAKLSPTPLERTEGLEQLRVLEHGYDVMVARVRRAAIGIDTPDDYAAFVRRTRRAAVEVETDGLA